METRRAVEVKNRLIAAAVGLLVAGVWAGPSPAQTPAANPCDTDPTSATCTLCRLKGTCQPPKEVQPEPSNLDHPCGRSMWVASCPARLDEVSKVVSDLHKSVDQCATAVKEGTGYRDTKMVYGFSCERDMTDLKRQLSLLDGFELTLDLAPQTATENGRKHLEVCVDEMIKPLYEKVVPESIRSARPLDRPLDMPPDMPSSPKTPILTPRIFDTLNRLVGFKSIDLPELDIRIREQAETIRALRERMKAFEEDCASL
jgi:hypothetical protein